ncbi:Hsp20/alpha crystallin family protein [Anaeromassilibacillus senegalensis]|uniref:Hsp20/alpha crystallin family protein n=1 Tax=Anaeromassilibacillus senegalensis TaxID=1673717 RepID=UPI001FA80339|nr:Hsp20/alpha crystallin family protein [Anaeromassilibacillus senegalensis]
MMFDLIPFEHRNNNLFNYFDQMSRNFFGEAEKEFAPCNTDIIDQGNQYLLKADLPGFSKEDVHIDIDGDRLTISAEHTEETKNEDKNFIRRERRYGSMSRSFDISSIDAGSIQAEYKNGVLELILPKKQEAVPASRRIEIK